MEPALLTLSSLELVDAEASPAALLAAHYYPYYARLSATYHPVVEPPPLAAEVGVRVGVCAC
jgi:hypothetical protein